jgi:hypothetical protein
MEVKVELKAFKTVDGVDTLEISPAGTRRKIRSWYIWVKEDGSGILIKQDGTRLMLTANQANSQ